jgi:hypothetical protein
MAFPKYTLPAHYRALIDQQEQLCGKHCSSAGPASCGAAFKTPTYDTPQQQMANNLVCPRFLA